MTVCLVRPREQVDREIKGKHAKNKRVRSSEGALAPMLPRATCASENLPSPGLKISQKGSKPPKGTCANGIASGHGFRVAQEALANGRL